MSTTESGATPYEFRQSAIDDCNRVAEELSGEPEIARLKAENAKLREAVTFRRFEHVLLKHEIVSAHALEDPDGYDNYRTHSAVRAAHRELTES